MKKIILLLTVAGLTSCNNQMPLAQLQSTPVTFRSKADATQIVHKEIPELGSSYTGFEGEERQRTGE